MSHITTVKTTLKDGEILKKILKKMNYEIHECRLGQMKAGAPAWRDVEFFAMRSGRKLGFKQGPGDPHYLVLTDWSTIKKKQTDIINEIKQRYSQEKIIQMAQRRGYAIITNRTNYKGQIEIVLRKVA